MRLVLQRVSNARVEVGGEVTGSIEKGLLVLVGVERSDSRADVDYLVDKVAGLRVFSDNAGKMNLSLRDIGGSLLVVSQFTLYADCRKGRRPSFDLAAGPELASELYEYFVESARKTGLAVETGVFQADMNVHLVNQGPVTIILESARKVGT
jgi:D-tyrosyl-tRNA(Tyr) deacylase